jgi:hypothetical protein
MVGNKPTDKISYEPASFWDKEVLNRDLETDAPVLEAGD